MLASVLGRTITVDGGTTLCSGVTVPVIASLVPIVTVQKSISDVVKEGIVITVVLVTVTPLLIDQTAVVTGGHETVIALESWSGGKTMVQGG